MVEFRLASLVFGRQLNLLSTCLPGSNVDPPGLVGMELEDLFDELLGWL